MDQAKVKQVDINNNHYDSIWIGLFEHIY